MSKLNAKRRNALPKSDFALPGRRYPIEDPSHARNAEARVSANGSASEKAKVRAAVHRKFPSIREAAQHIMDCLLSERDDIGKLPMPAAAKAYARRTGLRSMERQPEQFIDVVAQAVNHGRKDFKIRDVVGPVKMASKVRESLDEVIVYAKRHGVRFEGEMAGRALFTDIDENSPSYRATIAVRPPITVEAFDQAMARVVVDYLIRDGKSVTEHFTATGSLGTIDIPVLNAPKKKVPSKRKTRSKWR